MMSNTQDKILLEAIRKVGKRIDDLESVTNDIKKDIGDDRVKIDNVVLAQAGLKATLEIMRGDINNLSKKSEKVVKDAMEDVLEPATESIEQLTKEIKKKETLIIFKNGFLDFIKNKLRRGGERK